MSRPRFCYNPDCTRKTPFSPTHDGALYCCTKCKNRSNYISSIMEYDWEVLRAKERKRNIKILEYLHSINQIKVTHDLLKTMGFVFEVTFVPFFGDDGVPHLRFGNSFLRCTSEDHYEISYIDN